MNDDERKLLMLLTDDVRSMKQTLHGPPGLPNGLMGEISEIKKDVKACRAENREEGNDVRKSIRNLGFTVAGSLATIFLASRFLGA